MKRSPGVFLAETGVLSCRNFFGVRLGEVTGTSRQTDRIGVLKMVERSSETGVFDIVYPEILNRWRCNIGSLSVNGSLTAQRYAEGTFMFPLKMRCY